MKFPIVIFSILLLVACREDVKHNSPINVEESESNTLEKVSVFNMGTFHYDYTSDAMSTNFDEHDKKNLQEIQELSAVIAKFNPTVILVESEPHKNSELQKEYLKFKNSDEEYSFYRGEIGLLAFDLGRRCNVDRIYGIDHVMNYNFMIGRQLEESHPNDTYSKFVRNMGKEFSRSEEFESLSLIDKMIYYNGKEYYDHMLNLNADILTYISSDTLHEGADEAAVFYHRNLRIFSNLNKHQFGPEERVFILMGAAHTAFLESFIERSPLYKSVEIPSFLIKNKRN